jgi:hypothetical protein
MVLNAEDIPLKSRKCWSMGELIELSLVRCAATDDKRAEMIRTTLDPAQIEQQLIHESEQVIEADQAKGLHLAAVDKEHGPVTYLQQVTDGGFFVYVGDPASLEEHWFGEGSWVAFNDHEGTGHASKVGPDGCTRTFRMLRGHLTA